jgi:predicted adenine nucleotide alpha hydrolase (AANH) superfamily ATPase
MSGKDKILVHTCCAACACYVLPHLAERFDVTAFFFNPNIYPPEEYKNRLRETVNFCKNSHIPLITGEYCPRRWWAEVGPLKDLPEKSERCWQCYRLRLEETASKAAELGTSIFTTTLSVSPHKIYPKIEEEGKAAGEKYGVRFLEEDFKKKDGFKISVKRSNELGITRQNYCGCLLSLRESRNR